jgi:Ca2+-binding EF-hand superfamily protein
VTFDEMKKELNLQAEAPRIKALYEKLKNGPITAGSNPNHNNQQSMEYREVFNYADFNHDGKLDESKVKKMLKRFNDTSDTTGVKEWITKHDFNND